MAQSSPSMFSATDAYADKGTDALALIARVLIGWLFLDYGWMKLTGYAGTAVGAQYANFCKNLAIMGGVLLLYVLGAGRFSIDAWLRR